MNPGALSALLGPRPVVAVVALTLAVVAVAFGVRPPGLHVRARITALGRPRDLQAPSRNRRGAQRVAIGVLTAAAGLTALAASVGAAGVLLGVAGGVVTTTLGLLLVKHRRRVRADADRRAVGQACSILAGQVRIGQVPTVGLRSAAEDCPILEAAVDTVDLGGDPVACWLDQARRPGQHGLADLARAWRLSADTGAELAPALEAVAEGLAADRSLELVVATETSAPRATGKIMAVLPLVGIALGYVMGGDPLRFLLYSRPGWACLAVGAISACAGVLWMEKIADRGTVDP